MSERRYCPECGAEYGPEIAACPNCRVVLSNESPDDPALDAPEVVYRVPDAAAGALLCGMLEHQGIPAMLRAATIPAYGIVRRDWSTTAWGEIMVPRGNAVEARALIADYLAALERGGQVTDADVEEADPT